MKEITLNEMQELNGGMQATGCGGWGAAAMAFTQVGLFGFGALCAIGYIACSW